MCFKKKDEIIPDAVKAPENLSTEELDQVSGGKNPFADTERVANHDYDDEVKSRI